MVSKIHQELKHYEASSTFKLDTNLIDDIWQHDCEDRMMHLADVLTEGRVCDHLAQEVKVCRHQCHDAATSKHWHVLLISQSHVLHTPVTH